MGTNRVAGHAIIFFMYLAIFPFAVGAVEIEPAPKSRPAAVKGVETLLRLLSDKNLERFGFKSMGQAEAFLREPEKVLGTPMRLYRVPLDRLSAFNPAIDPDQLLVDSGKIIWPVIVEGNVVTSVTVMRKTQERWEQVKSVPGALPGYLRNTVPHKPLWCGFLNCISILSVSTWRGRCS